MKDEEIINNEKYHTCGRCKYENTPDGKYPCNSCIYGTDHRTDLWELKQESERMKDESMSYLDALKEIKRLKETLNKIRAEIEEHAKINQNSNIDRAKALCWCLDVIDKYKASDTDESDAEFMCRVMSKTVNKSIADNNFTGGF